MSARTMTARTDSRPGRVWFVGAGPGSWDLLTIRAAACLQTADLVVHDALVPLPAVEKLPAGHKPLPLDALHPARQYAPAGHAKHAAADVDPSTLL